MHTHFLIGEAGQHFVTHRAKSYLLCVCVCATFVHIMTVLDVCMKSTGKVNEVLSREITLSSQGPYISLVSRETGNEDRDHNEVLSQRHQSLLPALSR